MALRAPGLFNKVIRREGATVPSEHGLREGLGRTERLCIVMACRDAAEAAQVGRQLLQVNRGSLITYRRADDVLLNSPAGKIALIILAGGEDPKSLGRTLRWMRHRWPRCPIAVVGDTGGDELEVEARKGGASYLARPVAPEQWEAMVAHVLGVQGQPASEETLG